MIFRLVHAEARRRAAQACQEAPEGWIVTIKEPTRTLDQNAALWPLLDEISAQVDWHGQKLSSEDWKHIFTSTLRKLRIMPNLDGTGFVALGQSSKTMTKSEFSDLLELATAFAEEKGVKVNV